MPSLSGTDTPVVVHSGDEAELEQWNKETEAPRGNEEDDNEDSRLSFAKITETEEERTVSETAISDGLKKELEST